MQRAGSSRGPFEPVSPTLEIEGLIEADAANVDICKEMLSQFSPSILEAIEMTRGMYTTLIRICGQSAKQPFADLHEEADRLGLEAIESLEALEARADTDPELRAILDRYIAVEVRIALVMRLGVLFSQAFVDFLRLRVTAPLAYMRVQVESVALLILMAKDPSIAREWIEIKTDVDGQRFFRDHQPKIKDVLRENNLMDVYDMASGAAAHSRFIGVARALSMNHAWLSDEEYRREYTFRAQEFDPDAPFPFYITVAHALRVQERIFCALVNHVPGIDDPIFAGSRIPRLSALVDQVGKAVETRRAAARVKG